jgi:hypothetical protein
MSAVLDLTLCCPTCGKRADMCFDHGGDWKKRSAKTFSTFNCARCGRKLKDGRYVYSRFTRLRYCYVGECKVRKPSRLR